MTTRPKTEFNELQREILELKKRLNAIIVAHNYQRPEVQDIADFVGDSLELARECTKVKSEMIVFCGVRFMAETAAILNPNSTVLLTHPAAGCPLADMINIDDLRDWKGKYPAATVVAYVNTTAAIKAESDICCTSANGAEVVKSLSSEQILFIPDKNLGHYVSTRSKKQIILYPGYCAVHARLGAEQVRLTKQRYPEAEVLVHPECRPEVIDLADEALSTSQMLRYAKKSTAKSFIIGTEEGILHRLRLENPEKSFHLVTADFVCSDMKKTTLETVLKTMEARANIVTVPEDIRIKAKQAIDRMLAIT